MVAHIPVAQKLCTNKTPYHAHATETPGGVLRRRNGLRPGRYHARATRGAKRRARLRHRWRLPVVRIEPAVPARVGNAVRRYRGARIYMPQSLPATAAVPNARDDAQQLCDSPRVYRQLWLHERVPIHRLLAYIPRTRRAGVRCSLVDGLGANL